MIQTIVSYYLHFWWVSPFLVSSRSTGKRKYIINTMLIQKSLSHRELVDFYSATQCDLQCHLRVSLSISVSQNSFSRSSFLKQNVNEMSSSLTVNNSFQCIRLFLIVTCILVVLVIWLFLRSLFSLNVLLFFGNT